MRKLLIYFFFSLSVSAIAQIVTPQEKAVLDIYYAKRETNSINGAWIIDGSIAFAKLTNSVQVMLNNGSNAWVWVTSNSNDFFQITQRTSNWDTVYNWYLANSNSIARHDYVDTVTATTTLSTALGHILVDSSSFDVDVNLPGVAIEGEWYTVKWIAGTNNVYLKAPTGDWIETYTNTYEFGSLRDSVSVYHDGTTNWYFK